MYRLGARLRLDLDPPEATVEVDTIVSAVIAARAVGLVEDFRVADGDDVGALAELYAYVVDEARPTWDFVDHRGPIPPTVEGFLRLPLPIALAIVDRWTDTLNPSPDPDAAAGPDGGGPIPGPSDAELAAARSRSRTAGVSPPERPDA